MNQHSSQHSHNLGYILLLTLVAALGGFLFGYDTGVISGAIGFLTQHFQLSAGLTGWAASSLVGGCVVGAMVAGVAGDRFGRKACLIGCAVLVTASSILSATPASLGPFAWARFAGGIAIGAASMLSPMYIAEIAPEKIRGRLVGLYQLAIVVGMLIVFFVNMIIERLGDQAWDLQFGWRWMFASLAIPSAVFGVLLFFVPESPRWLMKSGRRDAAQRVLVRVGGEENARRAMTQIEAALQEEEGRWSELFTTYSRALIVGTLLAVFSQIGGINAVWYYAPEIFKAAGASTNSAFMATVVLGCVGLVVTLIAMWLVDKAGRKPLLVVGTVLQIVALGFVGLMFHLDKSGLLLLLGIILFVGAFDVSTGPVSWIFNSEIFPNKFRGRAMSVAVTGLWFADWAVTQTFPMLRDGIGPAKTFWVYAVSCCLCLIYILSLVPETKGRTLEEIEAAWKRIK